MIGIYKIQNLINNKIYVGSSKSLKRRQYQHFMLLKKNKHGNPYLQHSYNKYGKDSFVFFVLEECLEEQLIERESYWITYYNSANSKFGYNIDSFESGRRKVSDSSKIKMKSSNKTLKSISQYDLNDNFICSFDSIKECSLMLNLKRQSIQRVLKNKKKSTGGFSFKYNVEEHKHVPLAQLLH